MAATTIDDVIGALISELQGADVLAYVPDDYIVERAQWDDDPGAYVNYAIVIALRDQPVPVNRMGGILEQTFEIDIVVYVNIPGATSSQRVGGCTLRGNTFKGMHAVISDIQSVLWRNTLGDVLRSPGRPTPGGAIEPIAQGEQAVAVRARLVYTAETRDAL